MCVIWTAKYEKPRLRKAIKPQNIKYKEKLIDTS